MHFIQIWDKYQMMMVRSTIIESIARTYENRMKETSAILHVFSSDFFFSAILCEFITCGLICSFLYFSYFCFSHPIIYLDCTCISKFNMLTDYDTSFRFTPKIPIQIFKKYFSLCSNMIKKKPRKWTWRAVNVWIDSTISF